MNKDSLKKDVYNYYAHSTGYLTHLEEKDEIYFYDYAALVERYCSNKDARVLDLGAGTAISTKLLAKSFANIFGSDISALFLKSQRSLRNRLFVADATELPLARQSFDLVCSYEFIEHVENIPLLLDEMARITGQHGKIIIVSPNLLSPIRPVREIIKHLIGRPDRTPWSQTLGEAINWLFFTLYANLKKLVLPTPDFIYREPDFSDRADCGGDFDSVYMAHPLDLVKYLKMKGFAIQSKSIGRKRVGKFFAKYLPFFATSIAIVAERK